MLHLLCCIRLHSTPCQIFCNNHLWCSGLKQWQNTNFNFHKAPQEKGEGNQIWRWHTPLSGLPLTKPMLWQLHVHECRPLTVDVWQSLPWWKSLVWNQIQIMVERMKSKIYGMKFRIIFMCATQWTCTGYVRLRRLLGLLFTTESLMFVCLNYFLTNKFM